MLADTSFLNDPPMVLLDFLVPEGTKIEGENFCFADLPPGVYFVIFASKWYSDKGTKITLKLSISSCFFWV